MTTPANTGISSVADFKKAANKSFELPLPSGFKCLVRRPGIVDLLAEDIFPDSLMGLVSEMVAKGQGKKPADRKSSKSGNPAKKAAASKTTDSTADMDRLMAEVTSDTSKLKDMMIAIDRCAVFCLVEPKMLSAYDSDGKVIPEEDRDEELLYSDEVDSDDKMAIFDFAVGGEGEGLATFLDSGQDVGTVSDGEDVALPTK